MQLCPISILHVLERQPPQSLNESWLRLDFGCWRLHAFYSFNNNEMNTKHFATVELQQGTTEWRIRRSDCHGREPLQQCCTTTTGEARSSEKFRPERSYGSRY